MEEQKSSPNTLIDASSVDLTKLGDDLNKGKGMNGGGPWQGFEPNSGNQETKKAEQSDTTQ